MQLCTGAVSGCNNLATLHGAHLTVLLNTLKIYPLAETSSNKIMEAMLNGNNTNLESEKLYTNILCAIL